MKLHDKIRQIRKEKGISLTDLEKRLVDLFGKKALRYTTLYRIEKGLRDGRIASLSQIAVGLDVSLKELKEGTEEEASTLVDINKRKDKVAQYLYSDKAYIQMLTKEKQPFLGTRLVLEPQGKTRLEQDPIELGKFQKWIYVLKGEITCVIGENRFTAHKDETLCFESTLPHYFENNSSKKAVAIIIQNPRHI